MPTVLTSAGKGIPNVLGVGDMSRRYCCTLIIRGVMPRHSAFCSGELPLALHGKKSKRSDRDL